MTVTNYQHVYDGEFGTVELGGGIHRIRWVDPGPGQAPMHYVHPSTGRSTATNADRQRARIIACELADTGATP